MVIEFSGKQASREGRAVTNTTNDVLDKLMPQLTDFGKHLFSLMLSRNIRTFAELRELLAKNGFDVHRQTISHYATGKYEAPPRFVRKLAEVLDLSEEEKRKLAWVHDFGD
jgi:hypothetical protein